MMNPPFFKMVIGQLANCRKLRHAASFGEFLLGHLNAAPFSASAAALWLCHAMQKLSGLPVASLRALGPHPRLKAMGFPQSRFSRVIGGVDFELPGTPHTFGLYGGESIYDIYQGARGKI